MSRVVGRCIECRAEARSDGGPAVMRHGPNCSERVCEGPGCTVSMAGRHPSARFHSDACRARAWKERTGYGRPGPRKGRANGQPKPSGLQVSYRRAVTAVADYLAAQDGHAETLPVYQPTAESILRPALSVRQRARLEARER